ncbi:sulfurtransferase [Ramlibacter ginsenosidimutans]|uniref:Sulfurtransferase n=1 Tax=Ramlibacter ginsenosidimutans TaxID=502333 RepID=A0A934TQ94_9BURK|nr:rhodanese-like domain-containing protein [Ramlibacter ginsenosidimutans]MBK6005200.1 sulfurtransferase [Ramlibacter ginsenosidimutans]
MSRLTDFIRKPLAWLALAAGLSPAFAVELPGPVVNAAWLVDHRAEVQVVEVRSDFASFGKEPVYETDAKTGKKSLVDVGGHLPGARLVDFKEVRTERVLDGRKVKFLSPEGADFQARMQAAGIAADKPIVLVPMGQQIADIDEALRLYWTFKLRGEDRVAMLDGGVAGWLAEGHEVTTAAPGKVTGTWKAGPDRPEYLANSDQVAEASEKQSMQLVDARGLPQYFGTSKAPTVAAFGHVAGAKNLAPELLTRAANGALYFHPPKVYDALMRANGIDPDAPSISYCNTGHLASGAWFVMSEIMGNHKTRLYDGSMSLWTQEKRPLVSVQ